MIATGTPTATYRLQLTPAFTFADAERVLPHLELLGISHVYLSPVFEATPGSMHGYDSTDPTKFRDELGGESGFHSFADAASALGLGVIVDIVPNHMAANHHNPWWYDVMKHGQQSEFARWFDINWDGDADKKLVLPALGDDLEAVVSAGDITVQNSPQGPELAYFDKRFPLSPESELTAGEVTGDALLELIQAQHYRLEFWRTGLQRMNYRRFFDISDLVCVRVEDPEVFDRTHDLLKQEITAGRISGIRVDHVDGLRSPGTYLQMLNGLVNPPERPGASLIPIFVEKILGPDEDLPASWPVAGTTGYEFASRANCMFVETGGLAAVKQAFAEFTGTPDEWEHVEHRSRLHVIDTLFQPELERLSKLLSGLSVEDTSPEACAAAIRAVTARMDVYRSYAGLDADVERRVRTFTLARADFENDPVALAALDAFDHVAESETDGSATDEATDFLSRWRQLSSAVAGKGVEDTGFYRYYPLAALNEVGGDPSGENCSIDAFHELNRASWQGHPHTMLATSTHDTKRSEDARCRMVAISEFAGEWNSHCAEWSKMNAKLASSQKRGRGGVRRGPSKRAELLIYQSLVGLWPFEESQDELGGIAQRLAEYMVKAEREAKLETSWHEPSEAYEKSITEFVHALVNGEGGEKFRESFSPFAHKMAFHGAVNSLTQVLVKLASPGVPDIYRGMETWDFSMVDPDNRRPVDFDTISRRISALSKTPGEVADDRAQELFMDWESGNVKQWVTLRGLKARTAHRDLFTSGDYTPLEASGRQADNCVAFMRTYRGTSLVAVGTRLSSQVGATPEGVTGDAWIGTSLTIPGDIRWTLPDGSWMDALTGRQHTAQEGTLMLEDVFDKLPVALLISTPTQDGGHA